MGVPGLVILSTLTKSVIAHGIHKAVVFEYDNVIVYKNMNENYFQCRFLLRLSMGRLPASYQVFCLLGYSFRQIP
jgi:hypothetical protein